MKTQTKRTLMHDKLDRNHTSSTYYSKFQENSKFFVLKVNLSFEFSFFGFIIKFNWWRVKETCGLVVYWTRGLIAVIWRIDCWREDCALCAQVGRAYWHFHMPHHFQSSNFNPLSLLIIVEENIKNFADREFFPDSGMQNREIKDIFSLSFFMSC